MWGSWFRSPVPPTSKLWIIIIIIVISIIISRERMQRLSGTIRATVLFEGECWILGKRCDQEDTRHGGQLVRSVAVIPRKSAEDLKIYTSRWARQANEIMRASGTQPSCKGFCNITTVVKAPLPG